VEDKGDMILVCLDEMEIPIAEISVRAVIRRRAPLTGVKKALSKVVRGR
jgi:Glu-tRNA(Gln) amidotransferase subunit E-like FAD-binding protein